jgi:hypothetical protein
MTKKKINKTKQVAYAGDKFSIKKDQKSKKKNPKKGNYAKNEKYPALNPKRQVFNRRDLIDGDYYHLLNEEEKEWMNSFNSEYIVTNFKHAGIDLITDIEEKRACYRANNARNRDLINMAKSKGLMSNVQDIYATLDKEKAYTQDEIEDGFIAAIDLKRSEDSEIEED